MNKNTNLVIKEKFPNQVHNFKDVIMLELCFWNVVGGMRLVEGCYGHAIGVIFHYYFVDYIILMEWCGSKFFGGKDFVDFFFTKTIVE